MGQQAQIIAETPELYFKLITEEDVEATAACFAKVFSESEPTSIVLNITPEKFYPVAFTASRNIAGTGNGIVVKTKAEDTVVAYSIFHDYDVNPIEGLEDMAPEFVPVFAMFESMDEKYRRDFPYQPGEVYYGFAGGVDYDWYRRAGASAGPATALVAKLIELSLEIGQKRGYRRCLSHVTNTFPISVLRDKFGFEERYHVDYKTYEFEGTKPFAAMRGHHRCALMEKRFS